MDWLGDMNKAVTEKVCLGDGRELYSRWSIRKASLDMSKNSRLYKSQLARTSDDKNSNKGSSQGWEGVT